MRGFEQRSEEGAERGWSQICWRTEERTELREASVLWKTTVTRRSLGANCKGFE